MALYLNLWIKFAEGPVSLTRGSALLKGSRLIDHNVGSWSLRLRGPALNLLVRGKANRPGRLQNPLPERLGGEFRACDEPHQWSETPRCGSSEKVQAR